MKKTWLLWMILIPALIACNDEQNDYENIEFTSQGATLRGRLYFPDNNSKIYPVVVMAHGFSATINGMTADRYAEEFRKSGFAVLLYDHRNFGISDGEPRQQINFWVQTRGYIDAIDFVSTLNEIDTSRIAIWGCSLSAPEAFIVGTIDERVKAIINQVPGFGDDFPLEDKDGSMYSYVKKTVMNDSIMNLPHRSFEAMPVVSSDLFSTKSALSEITAFRWFIEYGGRYGTNWQNTVTITSTDRPDNFHVGQLAGYLKAPILIVVASFDEMGGASTEVTREVYNMISQPKELVEVDGGHFGLLHYPGPVFDKSSKTQINFLRKYF